MRIFYPLAFILSFLAAIIITPIVIKLAKRYGMVDMPNARSVHKKPVARVGGIAIFISTMAVVSLFIFIPSSGIQNYERFREVIIILCASAAIFAIGLVDDIKHLHARYKFISQSVVASCVYFFGVSINTISVSGVCSIELPFVLSFLLTVVWLVGATNAVNLIDGLDGLAAGIVAIAAAVIGVLSLFLGNAVLAVIMFTLFGSLVGFLFYNFNPAKIFLGDCGSLFIGFLVAGATAITASKTHAIVGFALPILALGIPIFDTFFSMLRRFLERRGLMSADRGHFHHRLLDMGLSQKTVVIIAYIFTLVVVSFGLFMMATKSFSTLLVFFCCLIIILIGFRAVGAIRLRQTIEGIGAKAAMARKARIEVREFEDIQLHFRNAADVGGWWDAMSLTAARMGFAQIELKGIDKDATAYDYKWDNGDIGNMNCLIAFDCPLEECRGDDTIKLTVRVSRNSFDFETIGRRLTLLCRLLDEYGIKKIGRYNGGEINSREYF